MVGAGTSYDALRASWSWEIPADLHVPTWCADRHPADHLALIDVAANGAVRRVTFGEVAARSRRLANGLAGLGIRPGDRVGVVLPQRLETALTHLAVYRIGAVAVPLSVLFGPDALAYRLGDADVRVVVADADVLDVVIEAVRDLPDVRVVVVDDAEKAIRPPHTALSDLLRASDRLGHTPTGPDTPALLIYTSGTTGPPKGALHGHRVLPGHLPGYELMFDRFPQPADVVWTPADWAWIGGLMDALLPAWAHGIPVVAARRAGSFDPDWALALLARHQVTASFLPPTALKLLRQADPARNRLALRTVMSGGETLGEALLEWGRQVLGVTINEIYGQTEANLVVGNCASLWEVRSGSMGRAYPGHTVAVIDDEGRERPRGEVGEIAVRAPDPVLFLGYWNQPQATADKFAGPWLRTGDLGHMDDNGYLWFAGRADDVIISAGYRIGPAEIEDCLLGHPQVAMAAAIGVPDATRGEVVKAFVQLVPGAVPSDDLAAALRDHVRARLAAYEYPREIEFVDELPQTTTGKLRRRDLRARERARRSPLG